MIRDTWRYYDRYTFVVNLTFVEKRKGNEYKVHVSFFKLSQYVTITFRSDLIVIPRDASCQWSDTQLDTPVQPFPSLSQSYENLIEQMN